MWGMKRGCPALFRAHRTLAAPLWGPSHGPAPCGWRPPSRSHTVRSPLLALRRSPVRAFNDALQPVTSLVLRIHQTRMEATTMSRTDAMDEIKTKHGLKMSKRSTKIVENVARRDTISAIQLRNGYILLKVEYIKCIVLADRVYLFDVQLPHVHEFAHKMHRALQSSTDCHLPFSLRCIDLSLEAITNDYERRLTVFQPVLNAVLSSSGFAAHQTSHPALLRLLPLQNALMNFCVTLNEFLSAVRDLSISDADLWNQLMPGNYPEVKLIAESYVKITEELVNEVTQFQRRIDATRQTIEAALDIQRNNILNLNIHISIAALTTTLGALIAGIFGMNLLNHFEQHPIGFQVVFGGIVVVCTTAYTGLVTFFYRRLKAPKSVQATIASSDFYGRLNDQKFINTLHDTKSKDHWSKVLQLAVGKKLNAPEAAEVLMTQRDRAHSQALLGYEHYDVDGDGKITTAEVEHVDNFFGADLQPEEIDRLMEDVLDFKR